MSTGADSEPDPSRLVFVGGLHRSGTTPLSRVLASHAQMSGLTNTHVWEDEGQHLQRVYPRASAYGGPGRFALDDRAHLTEESPLATADSARTLWASWTPYWDLTRPLLLEKSPPNMIMGRFLQAVFPGAPLIVVMRHPVVVSLSTLKWRRLASRHWRNHASVHAMVGHWLRAHQLLRADAPHLPRLHVVKYEQLVSDPAAPLAEIQNLLGLEQQFDDGLLRTGHSDRYEKRWAAMGDGLFSRSARRRIERDYGEEVAEFGYDIADPGQCSDWTIPHGVSGADESPP